MFRIPSRPLGLACFLLASTMLAGCTLTFNIDLADPGRTLKVYADRGWQDTGVSLLEGEELTLTATSGRWFVDPPGVWHDASGGPDPWICGDLTATSPSRMIPSTRSSERSVNRAVHSSSGSSPGSLPIGPDVSSSEPITAMKISPFTTPRAHSRSRSNTAIKTTKAA
jgi:hypothetical protein